MSKITSPSRRNQTSPSGCALRASLVPSLGCCKGQQLKNAREYNIGRHYNCQSSWVIYVVTCEECKIQYTGQTRQTMVARHYGHRTEVKQGDDGLRRYLKEVHRVGRDLSKKEDIASCLESFNLQIICSV